MISDSVRLPIKLIYGVLIAPQVENINRVDFNNMLYVIKVNKISELQNRQIPLYDLGFYLAADAIPFQARSSAGS